MPLRLLTIILGLTVALSAYAVMMDKYGAKGQP